MTNYHNQSLPATGRRFVRTAMVLLAIISWSFSVQAEEPKADASQPSAPEFVRTVGDYKIPDVTMTGKDGKKVSFLKEIDDGRPVLLNFIFVSCSSICPMLSHVFSTVQTKLGDNKQNVHLISISIDPENDTPAKLAEYGKKFNAGPSWDYYTGTLDASIALQKAFQYFRGDKMNHSSVVFLRGAPGKEWVRLDGFVSSDAIIKELGTVSRQ